MKPMAPADRQTARLGSRSNAIRFFPCKVPTRFDATVDECTGADAGGIDGAAGEEYVAGGGGDMAE